VNTCKGRVKNRAPISIILPIMRGKVGIEVITNGEIGIKSTCCERSKYPSSPMIVYIIISST